MSKFFNQKNFCIFILFTSLLVIFGALYIEHILGAQPCILCKYQRWPYIVSIFISFVGYINQKNKIWLYFLIFIFVLSFFLSGYHAGIENNLFPEFSGCSNNQINIDNKEELLKSLNAIPPNCRDVNFKIFGLSLATINVLISLSVIFISFRIIKNEKNR